jgi:hypothetical protein
MSEYVWVRTSSHRSVDRLRKQTGWRPEFYRWGRPSESITVGGYFRVPAHKADAALSIKGVTRVMRVPKELHVYGGQRR